MFKKLKQHLMILAAGAALLVPTLVPAFASAAISDSVCVGVNGATGATGGGSGGNCGTAGTTNTDLGGIASKIVTVFSIIVGIVSVIMIIYGGFRYITSGGDSNKVGSAKNTIIYAVIGLIIVALAQFLVHYVLNTANSFGANG